MKFFWVLLALIAIIIGVAVYVTHSPGEGNTTTSETSLTQPSTEEETSATSPTAAAGRYVDYSSTIIADTSGTKILFFHAPWCPQCRTLEASIKDSTIPSNVTIIKVDYDSNQSLRQKYGVTLQTTLVKIDDNGNLIKKYVAYDSPSYSSLQANLL